MRNTYNKMEITNKYALQISDLEREINQIQTQIAECNIRLTELLNKKKELEESVLKQTEILSSKDWGSGNNDPWSKEAERIKKEVFKLRTFEPRQLQAINVTLSKEHAIVILPTGGGKSLCYQLPALVTPGITIVISPLVSLMRDQVLSLTEKGIPAQFVDETNKALHALTDLTSQIKLLYVTPEKFATKLFMDKLKICYEQKRLQRFAIDEVHCCSEWGHDFRPNYKSLGTIVENFPGTPILGLTATAPGTVLDDVKKILKIPGCLIIKSPLTRPNLFYKVIQKPSNEGECIKILVSLLQNDYKQKVGIIYTRTVKCAIKIAKHLQDNNINVSCYHGQMTRNERSLVQEKWYNDGYQAVVATIAFGLGIDKKNVRFVIHYTISKSMASYYQESGRAGRDNDPADCVLLYTMKDIFHALCFKQKSLDSFYSLIEYCLNAKVCRKQLIAKSLGDKFDIDKKCNNKCDICCIGSNPNELQLEYHCKTLLDILDSAEQEGTKYTAKQLLDTWFKTGRKRKVNKQPIGITELVAEDVIAYLFVQGYLTVECTKNENSICTYIKKHTKMDDFKNPDYKLKMSIRGCVDFKSTDKVDEPLPKRNTENDSYSNNYSYSCFDLTLEDDSQ